MLDTFYYILLVVILNNFICYLNFDKSILFAVSNKILVILKINALAETNFKIQEHSTLTFKIYK